MLEVLDTPAVAASGGARQGSTARYVLNRFGEVRFTRTRVLVAGRYDPEAVREVLGYLRACAGLALRGLAVDPLRWKWVIGQGLAA